MSLRKTIYTVIRAHKWLILIVIAYFMLFLSLSRFYNVEINISHAAYKYFLITPIVYAPLYLVYCTFWIRPKRPIRYTRERLNAAGIERLLSFFLVSFLLAAHMLAFRCIKSLIPIFHNFCWDRTFAKWDNLIHGTDPWRMIHPFLSSPFMTHLTMIFYGWYFFIIMAVVAWQAAKPITDLKRNQFLLTFALCWIILGNAMAIIFSSAGPCFYHYISPDSSRYAELISFLNRPTLNTDILIYSQYSLWKVYQKGEYGHLFSISAMPSMHVSITFLLVLISQKWFTKVIAWLFTIGVSLACVHLAWHYAIDIYAAILGTYIIWLVVGMFLKDEDENVIKEPDS